MMAEGLVTDGAGAADRPARICIVLCTCNGAAYLEAQLQSFVAQDHSGWDLWVSDDGSVDDTRLILERFRAAQGAAHDIRILAGPGKGSAANFLSLLCHPDLPRGPIALSDQDDVWLPHKLSRALAALAQAGPVALYGAQSLHTDAGLRVIGGSGLGQAVPSFRNALAQNIVSGHTAVLSAGAVDLIRRAGQPKVPFHDWWLYQVIAGAGGHVLIDAEAVVLYRQHGANALGAHRGTGGIWRRFLLLFGRGYGDWLALNLAALQQVQPLLTAPNRSLVTALAQCPRGGGPLRRALCLARGRVHRQSRVATACLYLAVLLGRV